MPLDSSSTLGGVGGGVLNESVPLGRTDAAKGPSTPASSLSQKAAENTIGSHNNPITEQSIQAAKEIISVPSADAVFAAEGNISGCGMASARWTRRGLRTWHVRTRSAREPGGLLFGPLAYGQVRVRIGKARSRS